MLAGELYDAMVPRAVELLGSAAGRAWRRQIAARVERLGSRWRLRDVTPIVGGRGGLVLAARSGRERVVAKLPFRRSRTGSPSASPASRRTSAWRAPSRRPGS